MCRGRRQATTEKKAPACGSNQPPDIAAEAVASKTCLARVHNDAPSIVEPPETSLHRGGIRAMFIGLAQQATRRQKAA